MNRNIKCPECGKQLNEGMFVKEGKAFLEFYCMNDICSRRYNTVLVMPLPPLSESDIISQSVVVNALKEELA